MRWCVLCSLVLVAAPAAADVGAQAARDRILAPATDFTAPERWEALSGGTATNRTRFDQEAFSQPSANLSFEARGEFFVGNGLFRRLWVSAPASTRSADGLGPLYNARACQRCHLKDGRGHPPDGPADSRVSMLLRLSRLVPAPAADGGRPVKVHPDPVYGVQLQDVAVPGHRAEGRIAITHDTVTVALGGGGIATLLRPRVEVEALSDGPLHPDTRLSARIAPPMIGLGLLEAIDENDILAHADPDDADGDGISGRPNRVWSTSQRRTMPGRFGWKAGEATIADQSASAMAGDIGISNPLAPWHWGDCTARQPRCRSAPHGADDSPGSVEASAGIMDAIVFYSRNLAVPARRRVADPDVLRGKALFYRAGCTGCHVPKHATRRDWPVEALAGQLVWPYTDLLLHDMGDGLADGSPEGDASGREWRTAPLWGIGLTATVNGHTRFLHDGRARNLGEAILWHGGEAWRSREVFRLLPAADRAALLEFLDSL